MEIVHDALDAASQKVHHAGREGFS